jgi:hypothetical protein
VQSRREDERKKNRRSTGGLREKGAADCDPQIVSGLLYEQQRRIDKYEIMNSNLTFALLWTIFLPQKWRRKWPSGIACAC